MPTRLTPKTSGESSSIIQGPAAFASPTVGASTSCALKRRRKSGLKALGGSGGMGGREGMLRFLEPRMGLILLREVRPGGELLLAFGSFFGRTRAGRGTHCRSWKVVTLVPGSPPFSAYGAV